MEFKHGTVYISRGKLLYSTGRQYCRWRNVEYKIIQVNCVECNTCTLTYVLNGR